MSVLKGIPCDQIKENSQGSRQGWITQNRRRASTYNTGIHASGQCGQFALLITLEADAPSNSIKMFSKVEKVSYAERFQFVGYLAIMNCGYQDVSKPVENVSPSVCIILRPLSNTIQRQVSDLTDHVSNGREICPFLFTYNACSLISNHKRIRIGTSDKIPQPCLVNQ